MNVEAEVISESTIYFMPNNLSEHFSYQKAVQIDNCCLRRIYHKNVGQFVRDLFDTKFSFLEELHSSNNEIEFLYADLLSGMTRKFSSIVITKSNTLIEQR